MNQLVTTFTGGMPIVLDDLRWNDSAYRAAMNAILLAFGNNFIVQGCVPTVSLGVVSISAGYIMLNGQLLQVDAHTTAENGYYQLVTSYNSAGQKTFANGITEQTYQQNRGLATAYSGNLQFNGPTLASLLVLQTSVGKQAGKVPKVGALDLQANEAVVTDNNGNLQSQPIGANAGNIPEVGLAGLNDNAAVVTDNTGKLITNAIGASAGMIPKVGGTGLGNNLPVVTDNSGNITTQNSNAQPPNTTLNDFGAAVNSAGPGHSVNLGTAVPANKLAIISIGFISTSGSLGAFVIAKNGETNDNNHINLYSPAGAGNWWTGQVLCFVDNNSEIEIDQFSGIAVQYFIVQGYL